MAGRPTDKQKELEAKKILEELGYKLIEPNKFQCIATGKTMSVKQGNFYQTNNPQYGGCSVNTDSGQIVLLPYSKKYIEDTFKKLCIDTKDNKKLAMYKLTQLLRIPWNENLWEMAKNSKSASWKIYIGKGNSLHQYSSLTMNDSEDYVGIENDTLSDNASFQLNNKMKKKDKKDALVRWGDTWGEFELARLEEFYHSMKVVNRIDTPQDEDYLRKLARLSVKIDDAIESGESGKAKQLGDLYSKYMTDSKFRAMDMTDADKQGGIRTFSQIYEEVERPDFIPPWKKYANFLNVGQDIVDKVILYLLNFTLKFKNLERMIEPPSDTPKIEECESYGDME